MAATVITLLILALCGVCILIGYRIGLNHDEEHDEPWQQYLVSEREANRPRPRPRQ